MLKTQTKEVRETTDKEKDDTICYTAASIKIVRNRLYLLIGISVINVALTGFQIVLLLLK